MNDAEALLAPIRKSPFDPAPRLVYADWLEERGDPAGAARLRWWAGLVRELVAPQVEQFPTGRLNDALDPCGRRRPAAASSTPAKAGHAPGWGPGSGLGSRAIPWPAR